MITKHLPLPPRGAPDAAAAHGSSPRRPGIRRLAVITTDKSGFSVNTSHDLVGGFS
jgi:hypothetical protein